MSESKKRILRKSRWNIKTLTNIDAYWYYLMPQWITCFPPLMSCKLGNTKIKISLKKLFAVENYRFQECCLFLSHEQKAAVWKEAYYAMTCYCVGKQKDRKVKSFSKSGLHSDRGPSVLFGLTKCLQAKSWRKM